jgi:mannose-6-phosphate isomerase-like protein (cupin superfamily)
LKADLQRQGQTVQGTLVNLLAMAPSASALWHMHPGSQEVVFIVDGALVVEVEGEGSTEVTSGQPRSFLPKPLIP